MLHGRKPENPEGPSLEHLDRLLKELDRERSRAKTGSGPEPEVDPRAAELQRETDESLARLGESPEQAAWLDELRAPPPPLEKREAPRSGAWTPELEWLVGELQAHEVPQARPDRLEELFAMPDAADAPPPTEHREGTPLEAGADEAEDDEEAPFEYDAAAVERSLQDLSVDLPESLRGMG